MDNQLLKFYSIESPQKLQSWLEVYLPLVKQVAKEFQINLEDKKFSADHLGLQVISKQEFDDCDKLLLKYCTLIHNGAIHGRRNRVYQFNEPIRVDDIIIPRIESFEPKPGADARKLRPGIEHIAFKVKNYEKFFSECEANGLPIDKSMVDEEGSKFFKTKFLNCVEIEFRNDYLKAGE
jgi:predicted metalloenzyme YecM